MAAENDEQAVADLSEQANQQYNQNDWLDAIKSYTQLLKSQPNNERALYRIAQAHINLKQGELASEVNEKLNSAVQIPANIVLYQKAQAISLIGDGAAMWPILEQAVTAGYRNLNDLESNPIWSNFRTQDQFSKLKIGVDKNINPCMYDDNYRAFDFWLGHWEVYGNLEKTGPLYGHNSITRAEKGCLIMEQWQGSGSSTGTSMNYYDGILKKWVQRWVSGGGTVIDYAGGLIKQDNGVQSMQLVGKIYYASTQQQPQIRDFRGTWTPLDDGVVQQFFEESMDDGETWYTWFNGYYFPTDKESKNDE
ncbi:MAG: tetratricopeptide repeat protein [Marinicella sp.]